MEYCPPIWGKKSGILLLPGCCFPPRFPNTWTLWSRHTKGLIVFTCVHVWWRLSTFVAGACLPTLSPPTCLWWRPVTAQPREALLTRRVRLVCPGDWGPLRSEVGEERGLHYGIRISAMVCGMLCASAQLISFWWNNTSVGCHSTRTLTLPLLIEKTCKFASLLVTSSSALRPYVS